ncbi:MAG: eukaryotic-like serine/threonine-protein kinase [Acidimicrobiaceae bacterium]|jgi:serine/threonine-protein kinase
MAQVWEATDEVLARRVAVKLLHPHLAADESFIARFRREAVAAARLSHPSIVSIYDTCAEDGYEAIVMELVDGSTLRELLDERKWLEPGQAVAIIAEVADALETAHQGGVVHRDVKPANILLSTDGRVLVADFGIAKAGSDLTTTNTTLGTAKYLAPEQVEGKTVDARADVYALGVVLYETLCGRPPFAADTEAATALARLHQDPMRPRNIRAGVPKPLEDVVLRAMARDPDQRYPSAAAFRAALVATGRGSAPAEPLTVAPPSGPGDATVATNLRHHADPTPPRSNPPTFVRTERGWLVPTVVIVLVATALIVGGILVAGGGDGFPGFPSVGGGNTNPTATNAVAIASATAFDPSGDGHENDGEAVKAIDGKPDTFWQTEGYNNPAIQTKPGVGLYVTLDNAASLKTLKVTSSTNGYAVQIYVADSPKPDLASWGPPAVDKTNVSSGTATFDLGGRKGAAVLIWFTNLGDGAADEAGRAHGRIAEISVGQS